MDYLSGTALHFSNRAGGTGKRFWENAHSKLKRIKGEMFPELLAPLKSDLVPVVQKLERMAAADVDGPIRAIRRTPARAAEYGEFPADLNPKLRKVLAAKGIEKPYTHQSDAYERLAAGENVVIVTPTASGKTLCYNLPVLNHLTANPGARAMYLFPTKALSEDQLEELHSLIEDMGSDICAFTYDGDTPQDARRAIRQRANVVLTNPDMLHTGILPHHTKWAKLFENLKYLVVDDAALLSRRLRESSGESYAAARLGPTRPCLWRTTGISMCGLLIGGNHGSFLRAATHSVFMDGGGRVPAGLDVSGFTAV
jgi:DEAD/DEAH box helicase